MAETITTYQALSVATLNLHGGLGREWQLPAIAQSVATVNADVLVLPRAFVAISGHAEDDTRYYENAATASRFLGALGYDGVTVETFSTGPRGRQADEFMIMAGRLPVRLEPVAQLGGNCRILSGVLTPPEGDTARAAIRIYGADLGGLSTAEQLDTINTHFEARAPGEEQIIIAGNLGATVPAQYDEQRPSSETIAALEAKGYVDMDPYADWRGLGNVVCTSGVRRRTLQRSMLKPPLDGAVKAILPEYETYAGNAEDSEQPKPKAAFQTTFIDQETC